MEMSKKFHKIYFSSESISSEALFQHNVRLYKTLNHFALNCSVLYHTGFQAYQDGSQDDDDNNDDDIHLQNASIVSFYYILYLKSQN